MKLLLHLTLTFTLLSIVVTRNVDTLYAAISAPSRLAMLVTK